MHSALFYESSSGCFQNEMQRSVYAVCTKPVAESPALKFLTYELTYENELSNVSKGVQRPKEDVIPQGVLKPNQSIIKYCISEWMWFRRISLETFILHKIFNLN